MASGIYNHFKAAVMQAVHDLDSGGHTIKVGLLDNSHAFTAANDAWADVSANEVSGTGYTTGGEALANQAVSIDDTDNEGVFDGDNVIWSAASITAYHAVIYNDTPTTPTADPLLCSFDFGGGQTVTAADLELNFNTEGIINLT